MAKLEVRLPQWGMGMDDGELLEWLVAVGDEVAEGDDLVEVEAAKTVEILVAPASGVLAEVVRQVGETVKVGEVIAILEVAD